MAVFVLKDLYDREITGAGPIEPLTFETYAIPKKGSVITNSSVAVHWEIATSGATEYDIFRKIGAGNYEYIGTLYLDDGDTKVSYIDFAIKPGTYTYKIISIPNGENSEEIQCVFSGITGVLYTELDTLTAGWTALKGGDALEDDYGKIAAGDGSETAKGTVILSNGIEYKIEQWNPSESDLAPSVNLTISQL